MKTETLADFKLSLAAAAPRTLFLYMARPSGGQGKETGEKHIPWFRTWKTDPVRGFTDTYYLPEIYALHAGYCIPGPIRKIPFDMKTAEPMRNQGWRIFIRQRYKRKSPPDLAGGLQKNRILNVFYCRIGFRSLSDLDLNNRWD